MIPRIFFIADVLFLLQSSSFSQDLYKFELTKFRKEKIFNQLIDPKNFKPEILNAAIFYATNEIRKENQLPVLEYSKALELSSTMHSTDMANDNFFNHTNAKNRKHREPEDRAKLAGVVNPHIAENIIEGFILVYISGQKVLTGKPGEFLNPENNKPLPVNTYLTLADELLRLWMQSPGHKANILSDKARQLGCGTALFLNYDKNNIPWSCVKATQNFQWFEPVQTN